MPPFRPLRDRRASLDALQELRPNFHASVEHATIRAMEFAMRRIGLFLYRDLSGEAPPRTEQAARGRYRKGSGLRQPRAHAPRFPSGLWGGAAIDTSSRRAACDDLASSRRSYGQAPQTYPIMTSIEPGEYWNWCYIDELAMELPS